MARIPFTTLAGMFAMICGAIVIFWQGDIAQGAGLISLGFVGIKAMEVATLEQAFKSEPPKENPVDNPDSVN